MDEMEALLPSLVDFLTRDLGRESLSPISEAKRQALLEHLDVLTFGPCPPLPIDEKLSTHSPVILPSSSTKRHSMPPTVSHSKNTPPNARIRNCLTFVSPSTSFQNSHSSFDTTAASSPAKWSLEEMTCSRGEEVENGVYEEHRGGLLEDADLSSSSSVFPVYEVPMAYLRNSGFGGECSNNNNCATLVRPQAATNLRTEWRTEQNGHSRCFSLADEWTRTSVSPHPETTTPSTVSNIIPSELCFNVSSSPIHFTSEEAYQRTLSLPKKTQTTCANSRRFSAFDPSNSTCPMYTLIGCLLHRYKPNKWTRLGLCMLSPTAMRLLGFKSASHTHLSPALTVFLCGTSTAAVYAGRDSGMEHVIKIAQAQEVTVVAADSEVEALAWVDQINMYIEGKTPTVTQNFLTSSSSSVTSRTSTANFTRTGSTIDILTTSSSAQSPEETGRLKSRPKSLFVTSTFNLATESSKKSTENGLGQQRRQGDYLDGQEDSGFSGPLSSSSSATTEGASGDAFLAVSSQQQQAFPRQYPFDSNNSPRNSFTYDFLQTRATGLFSSVRRKVESLSSRSRRGFRKSLVIPPPPFIEQESGENMTPPPPPPASCRTAQGDVLLGFGWGQLESGASFLLSSGSSVTLSAAAGSASPRVKLRRSFGGSMKNLVFQQPHIEDDGSCSTKLEEVLDSSHAVIASEAYINIPGRMPWTKRWCVLRSSVLEIYPTSCRPQPFLNPAITPSFSLPLQPKLVEIDLAGDKRRRSAFRLSAPSLSPVPILLDATDSVTQGKWIRGIIQALGHIKSEKPITPTATTGSATFTPPSVRKATAGPILFENPAVFKTRRHSELVLHHPVGRNAEEHENDEEYIAPMSSQQRLHYRGFITPIASNDEDEDEEPLYDEVAISHPGNGAFNSGHVRAKRWSLPASTFFHQSPLNQHHSLPQVLRPIDRLFAQPLPPLPSASPSRAASLVDSTRQRNTRIAFKEEEEHIYSVRPMPAVASEYDTVGGESATSSSQLSSFTCLTAARRARSLSGSLDSRFSEVYDGCADSNSSVADSSERSRLLRRCRSLESEMILCRRRRRRGDSEKKCRKEINTPHSILRFLLPRFTEEILKEEINDPLGRKRLLDSFLHQSSESASAVAAAVVARSFSCMTEGGRPTPNTSSIPSDHSLAVSASTLPANQTMAMRDFFAEFEKVVVVETSTFECEMICPKEEIVCDDDNGVCEDNHDANTPPAPPPRNSRRRRHRSAGKRNRKNRLN